MQQIENDDFFKKHEKEKCQIIDVRAPDEFAQSHLNGAINIPLDQIEKGNISALDDSRPIYLICLSGNRSKMAAQILSNRGFKNIYNISGGLKGCANHPQLFTQRLKKTLPLMRQVQVTAGSLVLLGVLLGHFVNPHFIWLSAFVGAGLIFAGLSGFCGMMYLLAAMPWNRHTQVHCENK